MFFQAYLNNIKKETGKSPEDFKKLAERKGFTKKSTLAPGVKAGDVVKWLKEDFQSGYGHAMAIFTLLKGAKNENSRWPGGKRFKKSTTNFQTF
jgi:Domain of unknown function (DUF4287)